MTTPRCKPNPGFVRTNEIRCRNEAYGGRIDQKWVDEENNRFEWVQVQLVSALFDEGIEWSGELHKGLK